MRKESGDKGEVEKSLAERIKEELLKNIEAQK
jgi:hypothetical protein